MSPRDPRWIVLGLAAGAAAGLMAWLAVVHALRQARPPAPLPVLGRVSGFTLTNQLGQPVGAADLHGRVWLADIIFTRCPGPCVRMTRLMRDIQHTLPPDAPVRFVSLTADPAYDTPTVLAAYAARFNADSRTWDFLTGAKTNVYRVALEELRLSVQDMGTNAAAPEDLFIHSTRFVLVDPKGALRGVFDGEDPGSKLRIIEAVNRLLRSP